MKKFILTVISFALFLQVGQAQSYSWRKALMDGSRTGVTAANAENTNEALGRMKGKKYIAPNGKKFRGSTAATAASLLSVQPDMADIKQVVAHSAKELKKYGSDSPLSNWAADVLVEITSDLTGEKVDMGLLNSGGIRIDMPEGPVLYDDIMSMFPFKNSIVLVKIKGSDLKGIMDKMAARWTMQCISGVKCVVNEGVIESLEIGGAPYDPERVYNLATISFLLNGGDGFYIEKDAISVKNTDGWIMDHILRYVKNLEIQGRMIDADKDGRVVFKGERRRR